VCRLHCSGFGGDASARRARWRERRRRRNLELALAHERARRRAAEAESARWLAYLVRELEDHHPAWQAQGASHGDH
jgi:hypothetical protein